MSATRSELDRRVSLVSAHGPADASDTALMRRVAALIRLSEDRQFAHVMNVSNNLVTIKQNIDADLAGIHLALQSGAK
jgi:hypothetical protein